jgi:CubicO group peptidase (beta-lactamase class C family)
MFCPKPSKMPPFTMRLCTLIAFVLCLFTVCGRADSAPKADFTVAEKQIQTWVDSGAYPGALLWIQNADGTTLYEHSWNGVDRETQMTIASASKWLEAATFMTLVDEGKLNLDTPIRHYFPQLTGKQGDNTARQLFSHTSNLNELNLPKVTEHYGIDRLPDYLAMTPTEEVPGDRFWYGGTDLATGARIVEIIQGKPWLLTFGEKVAGPCQMKSTVTGPDLWDFDRATGGDNFPRSCAQDYMNFLQMILHDGKFNGKQVLSPQAIHEMQADQVRGAEVKTNEFPESIGCGRYNGVYGLGEWRLALNPQGEAVVLSSPAYTGFFPWIDKRHNICGVFAAKAGWGAKIDAFHTAPKLFQLIDQGFAASGKPDSK